MPKVKVKVEGSIERALRQFKKRCIDAGLFVDIKRNAFYEKPSEERRREQIKRVKTIKISENPRRQNRFKKGGRKGRFQSKSRSGPGSRPRSR
ncbi:MAG: 30S ribosomal protein S21 [Planctomycetes bacterium]|nr:30S ribosomal protein S21 [Planctomycetota bacterium]